MFCPEGYVPFSELLMRATIDHCEEVEKYYSGYVRSAFQLNSTRLDDILFSWLFDFSKENLFLSSGFQPAIKIDHHLITNVRFEQDMKDDELIESSNIPVDLGYRFSFCNLVEGSELAEFELANITLSAVSTQNSEHKLADETRKKILRRAFCIPGMARPLLFLDQSSFSINFDLYNHILDSSENFENHVDLEEAKLISKVLKAFEGMALCIPESLINEGWDKYWNGKAERALKNWHGRHDKLEPRKNLGRGRKPLLRARSSFAAMGYDKGDLSWEAVSRKIFIETGEKPAPKTLRDWAAIGK